MATKTKAQRIRKPKLIECFRRTHETVKSREDFYASQCSCHPKFVGIHINGQHFKLTRLQAASLVNQLMDHGALELKPRKRDW
jgi:hypothetical protein